MALHNKLGKDGEQAAINFLISQGMTIRETNWKLGHLEIDIIAQSPGALIHVIEVKTRTHDDFDPLDAIDKKKRGHMIAAASAYVEHQDIDFEVQFDVMVLVGTPATGFSIDYIPDAFFPPLRHI